MRHLERTAGVINLLMCHGPGFERKAIRCPTELNQLLICAGVHIMQNTLLVEGGERWFSAG